jgi:hypothetical protein
MNALTRAAMLLLALVTVVGAERAAAQDDDATPVFLAMPRQFPDFEARAILMRTPGRDIVILHDGETSAETLAVALGVLRRIRADTPHVTQGQLVPITGFASRGGMTEQRARRLDTALQELRARPVTEVGNLGPGRWMTFRER